MNEPALIFGAALDYLDDPERLGLKLAYLAALGQGRLAGDLPGDPYDVIAPVIAARANGVARLAGKIEVPGWLTPRPGPADRDRIVPANYRKFMDERGIKQYVEVCRRRAAEIFPATPVMIGVDHGLAAGPIRAAVERYGSAAVAVVVLDAHFDAVPAAARAAVKTGEGTGDDDSAKSTFTYDDNPPDFISDEELEDLSFESGPSEPSVKAADDELVFADSKWDDNDYSGLPETGSAGDGPYDPGRTGASCLPEGLCGDFLAGLMEDRVVTPDNLYVVGVSDYPSPAQEDLPYGIAYRSWLSRGVKVYPRRRAQAPNFGQALAAELDRSPARYLYVSLDVDVGAGACMNAVRFLDRMGMTEDRIMGAAHALRGLLESERFRLAGLDVCEIEVHLLGLDAPAEADRTVQVPSRFAAALLGNMTLAADFSSEPR